MERNLSFCNHGMSPFTEDNTSGYINDIKFINLLGEIEEPWLARYHVNMSMALYMVDHPVYKIMDPF
jgi:hypothetical protein